MIVIDSVSKKFNSTWALRDINLVIEKGEFVSIVGHSGAGKTTLLGLLWSEIKPTAGLITLGGVDVGNVSSGKLLQLRRRLGVIFQDYRLLPSRTVFENVAFALEVAGYSDEEIKEDVPYALSLVGLDNKMSRFPGELSAGEQQRLAIARAIVRQPEVLLADEPTGNLDPVATKEVIEILKKINDLGTTVILSTHSKSVVDGLRKRVITLEKGSIIHDDKKGIYRMNQNRNVKGDVKKASMISGSEIRSTLGNTGGVQF